jgi:LacI family transcriptional regulator
MTSMIARHGRQASKRRRGRRLEDGREPVIGLSLDSYASLHWADVAGGATAAAAARCWRVIADPDDPPAPQAGGVAAAFDGLIAAITTPAELRAARACHVSLVNVAEVFAETGLPTATFDNQAIGRLAAEHLVDAGYTGFAFCGLEGVAFSERRREGFTAALIGHGLDCTAFLAPSDRRGGGDAVSRATALDHWLLSLPEGTGILAVTDARGRILLDACRRLGINVPGRLGVLGVGDFPTVGGSAQPSLSSVQRGGAAVGAAAVALLARLLDGKRLPAAERRVVVAPTGVSFRESTARLGLDEALALRAVTLVKDRIAEPCDVAALARRLQVSRRKLERAFQATYGESPRARVLRLHAEAALAARRERPDRPLAAIARSAGFSDARQLRRALDSLGLDSEER